MEKMRPYEMQGMLVRIAIAGLSLTVSIVILLLFPTWEQPRESWEISVWYYVCLLQAIGGVLLVVGSLKANHWLFLPWVVAAIVFIYTLLYKTVNYYCYLQGKLLVVVIPLFYIIAGFWLYFLCDVFQDFLDLHRKSSPQILSHDPNSPLAVLDSHSP
ncbi:uncharacterized protein LOC108158282 [Drosophila miranda]|uniref:uncharacterized protein LOC108158282 n=1 Tax=Drosophila miranda TaxID=7229 RepID=UPI0007E7F629|nr:uncharacterized protein LOC108158282 [Drosophila miranda]